MGHYELSTLVCRLVNDGIRNVQGDKAAFDLGVRVSDKQSDVVEIHLQLYRRKLV